MNGAVSIGGLQRVTDSAIGGIDIWELNEAFARQRLYCCDRLGIDPERSNIDGRPISIGHPYGMTRTRLSRHLLLAGHRLGARWGVVTMCVGGRQGCGQLVRDFPKSAPVAQPVEQPPCKRQVAGSAPAGGTTLFLSIAGSVSLNGRFFLAVYTLYSP